jgi:hypothetical protein
VHPVLVDLLAVVDHAGVALGTEEVAPPTRVLAPAIRR